MVKKKVDIDLINRLNQEIMSEWTKEVDEKIVKDSRNLAISISKTGVKRQPFTKEHITYMTEMQIAGRKAMSEEQKRLHSERLSKAFKGKPKTTPHGMKGKKHSEETKAKMRKPKRPFSEETKRKMSLARLGKPMDPSVKEKLAAGRAAFFESLKQNPELMEAHRKKCGLGKPLTAEHILKCQIGRKHKKLNCSSAKGETK